MPKFRVGQEVVCNRLSLHGSRTDIRLGLVEEMERLANLGLKMLIGGYLRGNEEALKCEHPSLPGGWCWFHEEDLKPFCRSMFNK